MAYYFRTPLDTKTAFQSIKDKLTNSPVYQGYVSVCDNFQDRPEAQMDLRSDNRLDDLTVFAGLEASPRHWIVYDRKLVAPDYLATMFDAGLGYSRAAGLQIVACETLIAENDDDENFLALFLVGCKSEVDATAFRDECENRDLVV